MLEVLRAAVVFVSSAVVETLGSSSLFSIAEVARPGSELFDSSRSS